MVEDRRRPARVAARRKNLLLSSVLSTSLLWTRRRRWRRSRRRKRSAFAPRGAGGPSRSPVAARTSPASSRRARGLPSDGDGRRGRPRAVLAAFGKDSSNANRGGAASPAGIRRHGCGPRDGFRAPGKGVAASHLPALCCGLCIDLRGRGQHPSKGLSCLHRSGESWPLARSGRMREDPGGRSAMIEGEKHTSPAGPAAHAVGSPDPAGGMVAASVPCSVGAPTQEVDRE